MLWKLLDSVEIVYQDGTGEEAKDLGIEITEDASKEIIYGMPYKEWKEKFQK